MAEEHGGQSTTSWPWLKLFSAFKIAILPSKLLLAALGILVMALGWNVLGWIFYSLRSEPQWNKETYKEWKTFAHARASWNLMHEMAGSQPREKTPEDLTNITGEQYQEIKNLLDAHSRFHEPVKVVVKAKDDYLLEIGKDQYAFTASEEVADRLSKKADLTVGRMSVSYTPRRTEKLPPDNKETVVQEERAAVFLAGESLPLKDASKGVALQKYVEGTRPKIRENSEEAKIAAEFINKKTYKPYGYLRSWPWSEYRGPNPFLVVTEPPYRKEYFSGFLGTQVPVLLEPLIKFFSPILYFFHPNATFGIRFYLFLVILWTLATWALFGGAITRIAVVQAARPNEKVGMFEALRFARSRIQSLLSAPLIPLFFLAFLTFVVIIPGLVLHVPILGELLSFLFWPLILIVGLIMSVVLIGLIGWPLMYATISAEGSDSFDALSRSYSYVFQGIWRYVWYSVVAVAYGIVLVFFVTLMGSLMVYMGKWGVSQTPFLSSKEPASDRSPTYLMIYAPRSFGWRDLLLYDSNFKKEIEVVRQDGQAVRAVALEDRYMASMTWYNYMGAALVSVWLYLVFLMMLGFSFSYFWTASSIIYLLMRKFVDDTEFDEIHLDEDEEEPMPELPVSVGKSPAPAPAPSAPAASAGFTMVDTPSLRAPTTSSPTTSSPTMLAPSEPSASKPTMLAPSEPPPSPPASPFGEPNAPPPPPPENPPPSNNP